MRLASKIGICLLMGALSAVSQAQPATPAAPGKKPKQTQRTLERINSQAALNQLLNVVKANQRVALFAGPTMHCTIGSSCNFTITPQELFDTNGKLAACAMQVGEIQIDIGPNPVFNTKTVLHWTIAPPAAHNPPTNATYTFEMPRVIVFRDNDNATLKKADGTSTSTDLFITHTYKRRGGEVIYYPVVFQNISGSPPALCGSADPRIVSN